MKLAHFSGAPEQQFDEIVNSRSFYEMSFKLSYKFKEIIKKSSFEMFTGMKIYLMHFKKILIVVKIETVIMSMALQIPELFL